MQPEEEAALRNAESNQAVLQAQANQQAIALQEEEKNMIKDQLDLTDELDTMEHLLRGDVMKKDKFGIRNWSTPEDPNQIILTEHGIYLIMNTLLFYLNKNTLLSNYDEDTINEKMEDFSNSLNDSIFMEYDKVFKYPTFEECKLALLARIKSKTELRKFALELVGKEANEEDIEKGFIGEIEEVIDKEIEKIREQIMKNKLKRFDIIMREIQDSVHSTYLRAYAGQERRTLRQHIHITENRNAGGGMMNPKLAKKMNSMNYG